MAGVFGKDPNMKRSSQAELDRITQERKQKLALAALKFNKKKVTPPPKVA